MSKVVVRVPKTSPALLGWERPAKWLRNYYRETYVP